MSVDYMQTDDADRMAPIICGDCGRPALYDYSDDAYHHAVDAKRGCFLIPAEERPDDHGHPLLKVAGIKAAALCLCGHAPSWHNRPPSQGGANWGPVGCYFLTEPQRPTVCGCTEYRP